MESDEWQSVGPSGRRAAKQKQKSKPKTTSHRPLPESLRIDAAADPGKWSRLSVCWDWMRKKDCAVIGCSFPHGDQEMIAWQEEMKVIWESSEQGYPLPASPDLSSHTSTVRGHQSTPSAAAPIRHHVSHTNIGEVPHKPVLKSPPLASAGSGGAASGGYGLSQSAPQKPRTPSAAQRVAGKVGSTNPLAYNNYVKGGVAVGSPASSATAVRHQQPSSATAAGSVGEKVVASPHSAVSRNGAKVSSNGSKTHEKELVGGGTSAPQGRSKGRGSLSEQHLAIHLKQEEEDSLLRRQQQQPSSPYKGSPSGRRQPVNQSMSSPQSLYSGPGRDVWGGGGLTSPGGSYRSTGTHERLGGSVGLKTPRSPPHLAANTFPSPLSTPPLNSHTSLSQSLPSDAIGTGRGGVEDEVEGMLGAMNFVGRAEGYRANSHMSMMEQENATKARSSGGIGAGKAGVVGAPGVNSMANSRSQGPGAELGGARNQSTPAAPFDLSVCIVRTPPLEASATPRIYADSISSLLVDPREKKSPLHYVQMGSSAEEGHILDIPKLAELLEAWIYRKDIVRVDGSSRQAYRTSMKNILVLHEYGRCIEPRALCTLEHVRLISLTHISLSEDQGIRGPAPDKMLVRVAAPRLSIPITKGVRAGDACVIFDQAMFAASPPPESFGLVQPLLGTVVLVEAEGVVLETKHSSEMLKRTCQIRFADVHRDHLFAMHRAIDRAIFLPQLLYPELEGHRIHNTQAMQRDPWRDMLSSCTASNLGHILRQQQLIAVNTITEASMSAIPSITFGCFGVGKTYSLIHAMGQIYLSYTEQQHVISSPRPRVLISARNNTTADSYISSLRRMYPSVRSFRFYSLFRHAVTIPAAVKPFSNCLKEEVVAFEKVPELSSAGGFDIIVTTFMAADELPRTLQGTFDFVCCDEAAQAPEPEVIVSASMLDQEKGKLVLLGDPLQTRVQFDMPLTLVSSGLCYKFLMGDTIMNRLQEQLDLMYPGMKLWHTLLEVHRCPPEIVQFCAAVFYEKLPLESIDFDSRNYQRGRNSTYRGKFPMAWVVVKGTDECGGDEARSSSSSSSSSSTSTSAPGTLNSSSTLSALSSIYLSPDGRTVLAWNDEEARVITHIAKEIVTGPPLEGDPKDLTPTQLASQRASRIAIVSWSRAQVRSIRMMLRGPNGFAGARAIQVVTVDDVQGNEFDVLLMSPVVSRSWIEGSLCFPPNAAACDAGLLNTLLTRVRSLFIVVGNPSAFLSPTTFDSMSVKAKISWLSYIECCKENGALVSKDGHLLKPHELAKLAQDAQPSLSPSAHDKSAKLVHDQLRSQSENGSRLQIVRPPSKPTVTSSPSSPSSSSSSSSPSASSPPPSSPLSSSTKLSTARGSLPASAAELQRALVKSMRLAVTLYGKELAMEQFQKILEHAAKETGVSTSHMRRRTAGAGVGQYGETEEVWSEIDFDALVHNSTIMKDYSLGNILAHVSEWDQRGLLVGAVSPVSRDRALLSAFSIREPISERAVYDISNRNGALPGEIVLAGKPSALTSGAVAVEQIVDSWLDGATLSCMAEACVSSAFRAAQSSFVVSLLPVHNEIQRIPVRVSDDLRSKVISNALWKKCGVVSRRDLLVVSIAKPRVQESSIGDRKMSRLHTLDHVIEYADQTLRDVGEAVAPHAVYLKGWDRDAEDKEEELPPSNYEAAEEVDLDDIPEFKWERVFREISGVQERLRCITIDPPNSFDLDDALTVAVVPAKHGGGGIAQSADYLVAVHITDVSRVLVEGSPQDEAARRRGRTRYCPGQRVGTVEREIHHMLPKTWATNYCSLLKGKKRGVITLIIRIDGRTGAHQLESIGRSSVVVTDAFTYEEADTYLDRNHPHAVPNPTYTEVGLALHHLHCAASVALRTLPSNVNSGLNVDYRFMYEGKDVKSCTRAYSDTPSHTIVDTFMVLANKLVASRISHNLSNPSLDLPGLPIRVQRKPVAAYEWVLFQPTAHAPLPPPHKSMGFMYTNFTSPLRRYVDVIVHRLLDLYNLLDFRPYMCPPLPSHAMSVSSLQQALAIFNENESLATSYNARMTNLFLTRYLQSHQGPDAVFLAQCKEASHGLVRLHIPSLPQRSRGQTVYFRAASLSRRISQVNHSTVELRLKENVIYFDVSALKGGKGGAGDNFVAVSDFVVVGSNSPVDASKAWKERLGVERKFIFSAGKDLYVQLTPELDSSGVLSTQLRPRAIFNLQSSSGASVPSVSSWGGTAATGGSSGSTTIVQESGDSVGEKLEKALCCHVDSGLHFAGPYLSGYNAEQYPSRTYPSLSSYQSQMLDLLLHEATIVAMDIYSRERSGGDLPSEEEAGSAMRTQCPQEFEVEFGLNFAGEKESLKGVWMAGGVSNMQVEADMDVLPGNWGTSGFAGERRALSQLYNGSALPQSNNGNGSGNGSQGGGKSNAKAPTSGKEKKKGGNGKLSASTSIPHVRTVPQNGAVTADGKSGRYERCNNIIRGVSASFYPSFPTAAAALLTTLGDTSASPELQSSLRRLLALSTSFQSGTYGRTSRDGSPGYGGQGAEDGLCREYWGVIFPFPTLPQLCEPHSLVCCRREFEAFHGRLWATVPVTPHLRAAFVHVRSHEREAYDPTLSTSLSLFPEIDRPEQKPSSVAPLSSSLSSSTGKTGKKQKEAIKMLANSELSSSRPSPLNLLQVKLDWVIEVIRLPFSYQMMVRSLSSITPSSLAESIALGHGFSYKESQDVQSKYLEASKGVYYRGVSEKYLKLSLKSSLEQPFTIVQAPPGTGKSQVGACVVKAFVEVNTETKRREKRKKEGDGDGGVGGGGGSAGRRKRSNNNRVLACGPCNESVSRFASSLLWEEECSSDEEEKSNHDNSSISYAGVVGGSTLSTAPASGGKDEGKQDGEGNGANSSGNGKMNLVRVFASRFEENDMRRIWKDRIEFATKRNKLDRGQLSITVPVSVPPAASAPSSKKKGKGAKSTLISSSLSSSSSSCSSSNQKEFTPQQMLVDPREKGFRLQDMSLPAGEHDREVYERSLHILIRKECPLIEVLEAQMYAYLTHPVALSREENIVLMSLQRDRDALVREAEANCIHRADVVLSTLTVSGCPRLRAMLTEKGAGFSQVLIDDVNMCFDAESMIAIELAKERVVLIGDSKQLPPVVRTDIESVVNGLQLSLMDRYRGSSQVILMREQSMMHESILEFPNWIFYNNKLTTSSRRRELLKYGGGRSRCVAIWPRNDVRVLFRDTHMGETLLESSESFSSVGNGYGSTPASERNNVTRKRSESGLKRDGNSGGERSGRREANGSIDLPAASHTDLEKQILSLATSKKSIVNQREAEMIVDDVEALLSEKGLSTAADLAIITFFPAQAHMIKRLLSLRLGDQSASRLRIVHILEAHNLDEDVILLSTTRCLNSAEEFHDCHVEGLGPLADDKLLNVALTRARYGLIVYGCGETMRWAGRKGTGNTLSRYWEYLQHVSCVAD